MKIEAFKDRKPTLDLEAYFDGQVKAWGLFQDRFGTVHRQFTVDILGHVEGDELVLEEDFVYDDGEKDRRVWRLKRLDAQHYEGRADDVEGTAKGKLCGQAFNFTYVLRLPISGRIWRVNFDDWMFMHEDGVLVNRAVMSKFGIRLGEVTLFFRRSDDNTS
ncbi:DUF3833 domain-containing protein [Ectothiorhodospira variabilis]|uniref:DUF3833 domain-containing protein n=1 Tax=Ectothiorhodospira variabilis TaxID=505694 RepID=UPI001EFB4419|nr:DUF3833 domain-containing protein [Ectothiorhodospira variabilis]MCG5497117.1 DUF3833 domain-containing protein [Ectothiorhodospira variabilis]